MSGEVNVCLKSIKNLTANNAMKMRKERKITDKIYGYLIA